MKRAADKTQSTSDLGVSDASGSRLGRFRHQNVKITGAQRSDGERRLHAGNSALAFPRKRVRTRLRDTVRNVDR